MSADDRPTSRQPHDDDALAAMWSQIGRRGDLTQTQMSHVFQIGEREGRAAMADAIEARDAEIAALAERLAALESVLRGLSCNVINSAVDGPFLHVRRETGMQLTDHQADAVRRALTTEGDTP